MKYAAFTLVAAARETALSLLRYYPFLGSSAGLRPWGLAP